MNMDKILKMFKYKNIVEPRVWQGTINDVQKHAILWSAHGYISLKEMY